MFGSLSQRNTKLRGWSESISSLKSRLDSFGEDFIEHEFGVSVENGKLDSLKKPVRSE